MKNNRFVAYLAVASGVLMQLCLGALYAWSTFAAALREEYGFRASQMALVFGTTIATFTLVMLPAGRWVTRYGPRKLAIAGALLFILGYGLVSFSGGNFWLIYLGAGVIAGAGIGCYYTAPLTCSVAWFPERKGLMTGLSVAGFGAGALLVSTITEMLLEHGWHPLTLFRLLAFVNGFIAFLAATQLRLPPSHPVSETLSPSEEAAVRVDRKYFWSLVAGMFAATFSGLLVIGHLKSIGLSYGISPHTAGLAVGVFAIGNSLGRLIWGAAYDRFGRLCLPAALLLQAVVVGFLPLFRVEGLFLIASFAIGVLFGSAFVLYASDLASRCGSKALGYVYPFVFLAYGASGIAGPLCGGLLFDTFGNYIASCAVASLLSIGGVAVFVALNNEELLEDVRGFLRLDPEND
ncbi:MAG: MFS transporter [Candidatus Sumerlaea sp.]|jgi:OFA family oxalate/formate antiporter-like MFS transporter|uniref:Oxalate/formate antiporter n=1 Tax=Sumerlaea chitinivorans TaxID=2250252 RepID=A0A2Z4Y3D9_SUMC1|nr:Oxalate/formate antiporter [Candidatus Sumerlaea chitinivorans]GIX45141.1 MAG: MFS transporter [Candidatus Sumerlaea sp.]